MTLPVQTTYVTATANGVTTVFAFGFKIISNDDLAVYANGLRVTAGITVSGAGNDTGGTVTFASPPANGTKLIFTAEPELSRTTDYQQFGDFNADTVNPDFDRLWAALQYTEQVNKRSIKLPIDTATDQVLNDDVAARAGKVLSFDANGDIITAAPADIGIITPTITPYIETLFDDANAAAARATLGLSDATASLILAGATLQQPAAPTLKFENTDTTIANNDVYGAIEFRGSDSDTNSAGVRSKITCLSTGTNGGSRLVLQTASGGTTTLTESANFGPSGVNILQPLSAASDASVGGNLSVSGQMTFSGKLSCNNEVSLGYAHNSIVGYSVLYNTDAQVDIDLLPYLPVPIDLQTMAMIRVQVVGKYLNSYPSGTVYASSARLFKVWSQGVAWDGSTYVILGAVLDHSAFNSDSTNFPAGAVNAGKALLVVSSSGIWLRLINRTSPASGSVTGFHYKVEISVA